MDSGGSNTHLIILAALNVVSYGLVLWNTMLTRHAKRNAQDASDKAATAVENTNGKLDVRIRSAVRSELAVAMREARPTFKRMIDAAVEQRGK
jgi:hypothetical protein